MKQSEVPSSSLQSQVLLLLEQILSKFMGFTSYADGVSSEAW